MAASLNYQHNAQRFLSMLVVFVYALSIIEPEGRAITRSFRLDNAWNNALTEEAEKQNISISALLEKIVRDYIIFYRWAEELDSVIFSPNTIKRVIEVMDEEKLREIARAAVKSTIPESFMVRGDGVGIDVVEFQITEQMGKYAHWFTVVEHETDKRYFYIKPLLGEKWSVFVEAYVSSMFRDVAGVDVKTERIGENILVKIDDD
jgi:hypothetical protein